MRKKNFFLFKSKVDRIIRRKSCTFRKIMVQIKNYRLSLQDLDKLIHSSQLTCTILVSGEVVEASWFRFSMTVFICSSTYEQTIKWRSIIMHVVLHAVSFAETLSDAEILFVERTGFSLFIFFSC